MIFLLVLFFWCDCDSYEFTSQEFLGLRRPLLLVMRARSRITALSSALLVGVSEM